MLVLQLKMHQFQFCQLIVVFFNVCTGLACQHQLVLQYGFLLKPSIIKISKISIHLVSPIIFYYAYWTQATWRTADISFKYLSNFVYCLVISSHSQPVHPANFMFSQLRKNFPNKQFCKRPTFVYNIFNDCKNFYFLSIDWPINDLGQAECWMFWSQANFWVHLSL